MIFYTYHFPIKIFYDIIIIVINLADIMYLSFKIFDEIHKKRVNYNYKIMEV